MWFLYLLKCNNGAYYAGITNDLLKRYRAHVRGKGAKYTRANRPVEMLGWRPFEDKSAAAVAEYRIKQLDRSQKLLFVSGHHDEC